LLQRHLLFLVLAAHLALGRAAYAQEPAMPPSVPLPPNAALDALVAAKNWGVLGTLMLRPGPTSEFARKISWLEARINNGGSMFFPLFYARNAWNATKDMKIDDLAKDPRVRMAGSMILYVVELIIIDGARCEDRSAPDSRLSQVLINDGPIFSYLRQLPPEWKSRAVDIAITLERTTAPLRTDDDLLCRGGLEEIRAASERGTQREVPARPGTYGRSIEVTPPADWSPKFVVPEVYLSKQAEVRAKIRETLLTIIGPLPAKR
jgi:hypothetical protein